jgi:CDP-2,3-bis-(O-geranylgeranyl)-sn-glycerol synthase
MVQPLVIDPILLAIFQGFWIIIPAYAANGFPPIARGKMPLDFGKKLQGKRILGDGKTIEGTIMAIMAGLFFGALLLWFQASVQITPGIGVNQELGLAQMTWPLIILITAGAIAGDLIGSFAKRQMNMKRGASLPIIDQLGFIIFALLFVSVIYIPSIGAIIFIVVVTPLVHLTANLVAYKLGLKSVWW